MSTIIEFQIKLVVIQQEIDSTAREEDTTRRLGRGPGDRIGFNLPWFRCVDVIFLSSYGARRR